ncbi:MAG: peptidylprolyl isomerase [Erysipelotrichaceae bacterium]|jgi:foldase protein PrsA|nr:peptidylprolyl isomerase [Erysipelotrichaceae bacterium]
MQDFLKKYGFVAGVAVILTAMVVVLTVQYASSLFKTKRVDGEDVIYSFDGNNVTADQFYEKLYDSSGFSLLISSLEQTVYRQAFEPDADMKAEAKLQADATISNFKASYGESYESVMIDILKQMGYPGKLSSLTDYYLSTLMRTQVEHDYIDARLAEYWPDFGANEPRLISHILIKMEDPDNPTEEELAKMEEAKAALAVEGADFAEVAKTYSDDTSASSGGSLGLVTRDSISEFVTEFADQVYTVGTGETTEWFKTEYGYHIIKVDASTMEELKGHDELYDSIKTYYPNLANEITWAQIEAQGLDTYEDADLYQQIKEYYGVADDEETPEETVEEGEAE